jgi:predicted O-methyltransferase YrrM
MIRPLRRAAVRALRHLLHRPHWRDRVERLGGFPRAVPPRRFEVPDLDSLYRVLASMGAGVDFGQETSGDHLRALAWLAAAVGRPGMVLVEVGSWKGASTAVLAHVARRHQGHVFAVDHWRGSAGLAHHAEAGELDVLSIFRRNLRAVGLDDVVHPLVMSSAMAASLFPAEYADLVFIDGDHRYAAVRDDVTRWRAKLRPGGVLCGHDSETYYSSLSPVDRARVDAALEQDTLGRELHPGVLRALYDVLADRHRIVTGTTVWYLPTEVVP